MKKILFAILLAGALPSFAQTPPEYDAAMSRFQAFFNVLQTDSIYNMLSDRAKTLMSQQRSETSFKGLYLQEGSMKSFESIGQKETIATYKVTFEKGVMSFYIAVNKDQKLETFQIAAYENASQTDSTKKEISNFTLKTENGDIYGTLVLPVSSGKMPVVLIIAGSGPTDRDCNNPLGARTNAFLMLADSLRQNGIASVRYDKRGVGESKAAKGKDETHIFDAEVNDAAGFIKMLHHDPRFSAIYVLGHSEGSLTAMLAIEKAPVSGFISLSGSGQSADKLIGKQLAAQSPELAKEAVIIFDSIKKGYNVTGITGPLTSLFPISKQPYLRTWMKYDPQVEIRKLKIPVMILQGTTDIQIGVSEAELLKKARPAAKLRLVTGMNHVLKQAPEDRMKNIATYNNPALPLSPGLVPEIVQFINQKQH